jgi:hypothetical protein
MTVALTRLRYEKKYPGSDPRNMVDLKHFAEAVGRAIIGGLDKEQNKPTVRTIRNKMRKFMSQWQRETGPTIPQDIHDSMAPVSTPSAAHVKLPMDFTDK